MYKGPGSQKKSFFFVPEEKGSKVGGPSCPFDITGSKKHVEIFVKKRKKKKAQGAGRARCKGGGRIGTVQPAGKGGDASLVRQERKGKPRCKSPRRKQQEERPTNQDAGGRKKGLLG